MPFLLPISVTLLLHALSLLSELIACKVKTLCSEPWREISASAKGKQDSQAASHAVSSAESQGKRLEPEGANNAKFPTAPP